MKKNTFAKQAAELQELLKRIGISVDELAHKTGFNARTLANAVSGSQKMSDYRMKVIRNVCSVPVFHSSSITEAGVPYGEPERRLRLIPVVSMATAGQATSFEDLPSHWMARVPSDTSDGNAFGVQIVGDSMAPNFREGETAILVPSRQARNGNVVVANIKNHGALMKLFHAKGNHVTLTSYNPAYPEQEFELSDFHWIYPVETVVRKILH